MEWNNRSTTNRGGGVRRREGENGRPTSSDNTGTQSGHGDQANRRLEK